MRVHARAHGREKIIGKEILSFSGDLSRVFRAGGERFPISTCRSGRGDRGNTERTSRDKTVTKPAAGLPGIEWAIEDTVNIQPGFPVATVRRKNGARGARKDIDAGVRRLPHSAPTSKLGVYTWQSRHFGVSTRLRGFIFTHAHGYPRERRGATKHCAGRDLSATRRKAGFVGFNNPLIRQKS